MFGRTHTPESRAQMSDSKSGANHPMYGKVAANAMTINVYSPYFFSICRLGVSPQANRSPGGAGKINL
jgi:hypothetical protein